MQLYPNDARTKQKSQAVNSAGNGVDCQGKSNDMHVPAGVSRDEQRWETMR